MKIRSTRREQDSLRLWNVAEDIVTRVPLCSLVEGQRRVPGISAKRRESRAQRSMERKEEDSWEAGCGPRKEEIHVPGRPSTPQKNNSNSYQVMVALAQAPSLICGQHYHCLELRRLPFPPGFHIFVQ